MVWHPDTALAERRSTATAVKRFIGTSRDIGSLVAGAILVPWGRVLERSFCHFSGTAPASISRPRLTAATVTAMRDRRDGRRGSEGRARHAPAGVPGSRRTRWR